MSNQLIPYLESFILDSRKQTLNRVLANRTRYITYVLEDLFQPHNASAVLRTCDCFGIQDIHIIENRNKYLPNAEIGMGAEDWLTTYKYNNFKNNSLTALNTLKEKGYRIIATSLEKSATPITDFDLSNGKCAIVFGTELTGISDWVRQQADEFITIPIVGFTESLNISVAAAIIANLLTSKLRCSEIQWQLSHEDEDELKLKWLRHSIKKVHLIENHFYKSRS